MCFVLDAGIILIGTIISLVSVDYFSSYSIVIIFINIMTAVLTAGTIEAIYMMRNSSVTINVISEHWEEIKNYLIYDLDRGCTIYDVYGGYAHAPRKEIKTVVSKKQSEKAKEEILNIDPNCFLSLTVSKGVFGEGFQSRFTDN